MYRLIRPLLFKMDPERAHHLILRTLSMWPGAARLAAPSAHPPAKLGQRIWDQLFPHPIGLAAGLDKNGAAIDGLLNCGFTFVEVGTVTPRPQPGNTAPRLFRLVEDEALINRMGFNNRGAVEMRRNLLKRKRRGIVGVNLGKNKETPNENAVDDYLYLLDAVYPMCDYIVLNVSSPNTPGLRDLQSEESLKPLVQSVLQRRDELYKESLNRVKPHRAPVLVKLAPDLADDAVLSLSMTLMSLGIDGFIATNTTVRRDALKSQHGKESGGLSGAPLAERSTEVIRLLYSITRGRVPIIGSGGVFHAEDAYEKIRAGASLVQVYTGFVYLGPTIVRDIVQGLARLLERDGFQKIEDAIGCDVVTGKTV